MATKLTCRGRFLGLRALALAGQRPLQQGPPISAKGLGFRFWGLGLYGYGFRTYTFGRLRVADSGVWSGLLSCLGLEGV